MNSSALLKECKSFCDKFDNNIMNETSILNEYKYFIVENNEERQIGFVNLFGFNEDKTDAELGVVVGDKTFWNKGIAYKSVKAVIEYAFKELQLSRIHIETGENNTAALRLFSKLGFKKCDEYCEDCGFKFIVMESFAKEMFSIRKRSKNTI